ncbi:MAG: metal ABC transporter substrate-binding protein [Bacilli bacterium]
MKKFIIILCGLLCLTGCNKKDTMEDITIYTTVHPLEVVVNRLYGKYSKINSIYPNGVNIRTNPCTTCLDDLYTLTEKQLSDYSHADLFIFNSLLYEGNYVQTMSNNNKNLKIINGTDNLNRDEFFGLEELWLDPSRLLTIARNIKNGFNEYIDNYYLKQDVENNFNLLKEDLDKLGAKLATMTKNAPNKNIVVSNDVFKFLGKNKFGLTVYSLENNENLSDKTISDVKTLIENKQIKYIYVKQYEEVSSLINELIKDTDIKIVPIHMLTNLTENEKSNKKDYFTIMNENIELIRKGLY